MKNQMDRREFAKVITAASGVYAMEGMLDNKKILAFAAPGRGSSGTEVSKRLFPVSLPSNQWVEFQAAGFSEPVSGVVYEIADLRATECGMPLGGIGTGCLDLNMDGRFGYCTLFKRVWGWDHRDRVYALSDEALKLQRKGGGATGATATPLKGGVVRDLSSEGRGPLNLPFLGLSVGTKTWVLTTRPVGNVETAKKIFYWGHYPVADLEYELESPVSVGLRAWSPFLPGDLDNSQIPGAVFEVNLRNLGQSEQKATVAFSFPGPGKGEQNGRWVRHRRSEGQFSGVVVQGPKANYALGLISEENSRVGGGLADNGAAWTGIAQGLPEAVEDHPGASAAVDFVLGPGQQRTIRFVLAWHTPEWASEFPYGLKLSQYTNRYSQQYSSALDAARKLADEHTLLLERILAWQGVIYGEKELPLWIRDQLINSLHLITEESYWATAKPPLGNWCYQGGLFSLVESTVAAGQQSCIPCDWYGNLPIVYFFPDLAWSTLRAYRVKMRDDGAVPFYLGQGLDLAGGPNETNYAYDRQRSQNGCCYADLVDRLWLVTGNDAVLREFYPSVKKNLIYTMTISQHPGPEGVLGVITEGGDEWYESMDMRGVTAHAGGTRLAQVRIVERMAEKMGDTAFAEQCRKWIAEGSKLLEEKLWDGGNYLLSLDPSSGKRNDLVLAYQLDGEWIVHLHGLPGVFRPDRVKTTLATIKRLNSWVPLNGVIDVIQRDGHLTEFGDRMGWMGSMPASVLILAMTYLYAGHRDEGLDLAHKCLDSIVNRFEMTWDVPNVLRSDPGAGQLQECMRIYGTDYYQFLSIWGLPLALKGQDLRQAAAPGGLVAQVIEAAHVRTVKQDPSRRAVISGYEEMQ